MGAAVSLPLPDGLLENKFTGVGIYNNSSFILLYPGRQEIDAVIKAIRLFWTLGIESEEVKLTQANQSPTCYLIKLVGAHFDILFKEEAVNFRLMITDILQSYNHLGWKLVVSTDLSCEDDQTTFIFQRQDGNKDLSTLFNIGLSSNDKLQISKSNPQVYQMIRDVCSTVWTPGIQKESQPHSEAMEIKLEGTPWDPLDKSDAWRSRRLITRIIETLDCKNVSLYGNSNLKSTQDTLFFEVPRTPYTQQEWKAWKRYVSISFVKTDRIRLVNAPVKISDVLHQVLMRYFRDGAVKTARKHECFEYKTTGKLKCSPGNESIAARLMISEILQEFLANGYEIQTAIDISRKDSDKDILLFREAEPLRTKFFCLSPRFKNQLTFINTPPEMIEVAKQLLFDCKFECSDLLKDQVSYTIELGGSPWHSVAKGNGIHGRVLILALINVFSKHGWRVKASMDATVHQNKADGSTDVHSLYFIYDQTLAAQKETYDTKDAYGHASAPPGAGASYQPFENPPSYDEAMGKKPL